MASSQICGELVQNLRNIQSRDRVTKHDNIISRSRIHPLLESPSHRGLAQNPHLPFIVHGQTWVSKDKPEGSCHFWGSGANFGPRNHLVLVSLRLLVDRHKQSSDWCWSESPLIRTVTWLKGCCASATLSYTPVKVEPTTITTQSHGSHLHLRW